MTKNIVAAATLVAALPAALLGYFLVMTFLTQLQHLSTMFTVLAAATLLCCAGVVFLPMAILIFGPRTPRAPKVAPVEDASAAKKKEKAGAASEEELEVEPTQSGDLEVEPMASGEAVEVASGDIEWGDDAFDQTVKTSTSDLPVVEGAATMDEFGAVDAELSESELSESELGDSSSLDIFSEDDFDLDEEEPKKKKKK